MINEKHDKHYRQIEEKQLWPKEKEHEYAQREDQSPSDERPRNANQRGEQAYRNRSKVG